MELMARVLQASYPSYMRSLKTVDGKSFAARKEQVERLAPGKVVKMNLEEEIKKTFRPADIRKVYRSFPLSSDKSLEDATLFESIDVAIDFPRIDEDFDAWLCVSQEGFRAFTARLLLALLDNDIAARKSDVINNYLSCAIVDPSQWFGAFSRAEVVLFLKCIRHLAESSADPDDFNDVLESFRLARMAS